MTEKKVIAFGELMLRLAPEGYQRFVQAEHFGAVYGGGEANVCVSLANYGFHSTFVTRLPSHEIGQAGINALRRYGVDISYIARGGNRVGIYYLEKGASQRPSKVIYDRSDSSLSTASSEDFCWKEIFQGADSCRSLPDGMPSSKGGRRHHFLRLKLQEEAMEQGKGGTGHGKPLSVCRCLHRQRGRRL